MTKQRKPIAAAVVFGLVAFLTLFGPYLTPHDPRQNIDIPFAEASAKAPLGTDFLGADVLSRVLAGGQALVIVALLVLATTYLIGAAAGMLAAYRRGWADTIIMRLADVLMGLPALVLLAVIVTGLGRGLFGAAIAIIVVLLPDIARVARAATSQALAHDYVEVAMARGESTPSILGREVLPNLGPVLAADAGVRFVAAVYAVATASFLGLGVQPPAPDWGLMIFENRGGLALQPMAVLAPAFMLLTLLVSASILADRLVSPAPIRVKRASRRPRIPAQRTGLETEAVVEDAVSVATGLRVVAATDERAVVDGVSLSVARGEVLALVGQSGSGKTTTALALLGHVRPGLVRTDGSIRLLGNELSTLPETRLRRLRAQSCAYVAQDPRTALPAHLRVRDQIGEVLRARGVSGTRRPEQIEVALRRANLPGDAAFQHRWPHQLSGGQRQRLALAIALAHQPALVVLDEPTSALDPRNTTELLAEFAAICRDSGTAAVVVSHDIGAVAAVADRVAVMYSGRIVETGATEKVLAQPSHPHTQALIAATAALDVPHAPGGEVLVRVREVSVDLGQSGRILSDVDLDVPAAGCVLVVGASGSGKTTLLRAIAGLVTPQSGQVSLAGVDLAGHVGDRLPEQRRRIQLVPQNPYDSLNPRHTVRRIVSRPMRQFDLVPDEKVNEAVDALLLRVGLDPRHAPKRPGALSGGERQRVALARALAAQPEVLLCDEVTSALDRTVAATVLDLLADVRAELGVALIVVTHDDLVVRRLGGQVYVVENGQLTTREPALSFER